MQLKNSLSQQEMKLIMPLQKQINLKRFNHHQSLDKFKREKAAK